jgi:hypothetical protein
VLDFNEDGYVCMLDLFALMKTYENEDDVYIRAYCHDTCRIVAALSKKARIRGRGIDEVK